MRFKRIARKEGRIIFETTYTLEKLEEIYPEVRKAIREDGSCCGALVREKNGEESLIIDRERWINE